MRAFRFASTVAVTGLLTLLLSGCPGAGGPPARTPARAPAAAAVPAAPGVDIPPPENRELKALVGGTLIHTNPAGPQAPRALQNAVVIIRGNRIQSVGPAAEVEVPQGAQVIDASGKFIIPGLIDGHIHFFQSGGLYTRPDGLDLRARVPYDQEIAWIRANMEDLFRRYLRCGVTTVVDMGGPMWNFDVRQQARDSAAAPRVFVAGPLIASYQPAALQTADLPIIKVTSVDQALALARKQLARKPDLMKIWYVVSKKAALSPRAFFPVAKAVADLAHQHGLPVFIHATELETAKRALRAGADVLVHSVTDRELDEEFLQLARKRKAILVPTLWVFSSYGAVYSKQLRLLPVEHLRGNPTVIGTLLDIYELRDSELGARQRKAQADMKPVATPPVILKNLLRLHQAGIPVAMGTDAGNVGVLHGPGVYRDLKIMADAGLTPYQVLVDATLNGARLIRREKELGSVEQGKLADLVVLEADPQKDIMNTTRVAWVIKDGRLFDPRRLVPLSPADLAQIQLNAYNTRQLEPFLAVYADDVGVYEFPDKLLFSGKQVMRQRYAELFQRSPKLHARLISRAVRGRYVVDHERVSGLRGEDVVWAVAIYEVRGDRISKVWFVR
jgi:imidazolonepropionase-like amidohydrolase